MTKMCCVTSCAESFEVEGAGAVAGAVVVVVVVVVVEQTAASQILMESVVAVVEEGMIHQDLPNSP